MVSNIAPGLWMGLIGIVLGPVLVYATPYLMAHRVEVGERPRLVVLVPFAGGRLACWQPLRTLFFEVVLVLVLVGLGLHYGASIRLPLSGAYSALLLLIAYVDLEHRLVLNRLSYPGIVLSVGLSTLWPSLGLRSAILGAAIGLAVMGALQIIGRGALGTGDTKLAILIGAMRGYQTILNALFLGVVLGGIGAAFYLFVLRRGRKESLPYAPYLAAGAILSFFLYTP